MAKLTISKIAELAGVSKATVSRVLNGYPHIRPELREKVQAIITQTGFQPNSVARSLAYDRSNIIGLIIPKGANTVFTDPYFPVLTNGVTQVSNNNKLTLALFIFHSEQEGHDTINSIVSTGLLDGLILTTDRISLDRETDPFIPKLIENQIPFVLVGRPETPQDICYIDSDNVNGGRMATEHLLKLGYRRIATIASKENPAGDDRYMGYRQVLAEHDIPFDESLVVFGDFTLESGYRMMQALLPAKPEAVFVASDTMAIGALRAIKEANLSVPEDIAIVGYDDLSLAIQSHPALTTIRQPVEKSGNMAVEMLLEIINDKENNLPKRQVILPCELVIRGSCGATNGSNTG